MRRIQSNVDTGAASFRSNREHNLKLSEELRSKLEDARHKREEPGRNDQLLERPHARFTRWLPKKLTAWAAFALWCSA